MNKDMINIDDFVREKLGEHREKEQPEAWLKMKDLLDKEMPEKAAPYIYRISKPMAFLAAALLIGVLCVGGYQLSTLRNKQDNTNNTAIKQPNTNKTNINETALRNENAVSEGHTTLESNTSLNDQNIDTASATANAPGEQAKILSNEEQTATNLKANQSTPLTAQNTKSNKSLAATTTKKNSSTATPATNQGTLKAGTGNTPTTVQNKTKQNNTVAANKSISKTQTIGAATTKATKQNNTARIAKTNMSSSGKQLSATAKQNNTLIPASSNTAAKSSVVAPKESKNASSATSEQMLATNTSSKPSEEVDANNGNPTANKDSMPSITIVNKVTMSKGYPKKPTYKADTVSVTKVPVPEQPTAITKNMSRKAKKLAHNNTPVGNNTVAAKLPKTQKESTISNPKEYTSAAPNTPKQNTSLEAQESTITKQKSTKKNWLQQLNLSEAIADAKKDIKNARLYAGFSGGINYSISQNNNFQGVQFGPTGELVLNKHWSLFGAIKYFNRSGGKKTINDSYSKEYASSSPDSTSGANWYYYVHTDSTNRYFNFSTLHSFEVPLTLRYTVNKFYLMTGINLAYYLSVNVEEVQKEYSPLNRHLVQTNATKPILNETKANLTITDFGSKFGIGYVFGAGYQITPAWQADLRVVNTFWDNATGTGAQQLSKDFYKLPSIQISVGYQFNRGKKRPTFGPTDMP